MIQGIDVVFLHTRDKDLARWYAEVLGLEITLKDSDWTEVSTHSQARFAVEHVPVSFSQVENQPIMISFRVDDIYQAVATLAAQGVCFHPSPESTIFKAGPSLVATFQDPAGNWLQLFQPKK
jgi:predicted enzyme related to lactoylglutathione lyase